MKITHARFVLGALGGAAIASLVWLPVVLKYRRKAVDNYCDAGYAYYLVVASIDRNEKKGGDPSEFIGRMSRVFRESLVKHVLVAIDEYPNSESLKELVSCLNASSEFYNWPAFPPELTDYIKKQNAHPQSNKTILFGAEHSDRVEDVRP
jgi:hypothetical protein